MAPILVPELPTSTPSAHLRDTLTKDPHTFLQPTRSLYNTSLTYLKDTLDPIASSLNTLHTHRLAQSRQRKRKRSDVEDDHASPIAVPENPLRLKQVHVQGFDVEQVWDQVRKVLDAATFETEHEFERLVAEAEAVSSDARSGSDDSGLVAGEESSGSEIDDEGVSGSGSEEDGLERASDDDSETLGLDGEDMEDLEGVDSDEDDQEGEEVGEYQPDPNGLNDGFFSIDDFNKKSALLEQADARGDVESDEEEIDFTADPLGSMPTKSKAAPGKRSKRSQRKADDYEDEDEDDDDDDEEGGPTFGDMDLGAPEGASDDEADGDEDEDDDMGGLANTNEVMYKDFFAPPQQKARKNKKGRPNPHNFPVKAQEDKHILEQDPDKDDEADVERTMSAVHRDLFEDESDEEPEDEQTMGSTSAGQVNPSDPRARKSTHERRQAALAEEIRRLEAANVAKRDWTLSGEARAADRPVNSLLEEDLDFERTGKPVTVVTAELSESIEELIKRRILAEDFDDLIRRRPDDLAVKQQQQQRTRFDLDDSKSKQGLAEMYEQDHLKATDANYVDAATEKSTAAEAEITRLWKTLVANLDNLSSWHFRPRQQVSTMDVRVDAPTVRLEDARPTAGAEAASTSALAPQEIYRAGQATDVSAGETTTRGGVPLSREEMTREEKRRRRRRDKERIHKGNLNRPSAAGPGGNKSGDGGVGGGDKESQAGRRRDKEKSMLGDLKRGGVKIIGKGEMRDVAGNKISAGAESGRGVRASELKL